MHARPQLQLLSRYEHIKVWDSVILIHYKAEQGKGGGFVTFVVNPSSQTTTPLLPLGREVPCSPAMRCVVVDTGVSGVALLCFPDATHDDVWSFGIMDDSAMKAQATSARN